MALRKQASIPLDNSVNDGDAIKSELVAAVNAAAGDNPGVPTHVRDANGKLIKLVMDFPATASAAALAAINANSGVATTVVELPDLVTGTDLDDGTPNDGIVFTGTFPSTSASMVVDAPDFGNTILGAISEGGTYNDGITLPSAQTLRLNITTFHPTTSVVIANGDLVINFESGGGTPNPWTCSLTNTVTIPPRVTPGTNSAWFWIDVDGKMYWRQRSFDDGSTPLNFPLFSDAFDYGAL